MHKVKQAQQTYSGEPQCDSRQEGKRGSVGWLQKDEGLSKMGDAVAVLNLSIDVI